MLDISYFRGLRFFSPVDTYILEFGKAEISGLQRCYVVSLSTAADVCTTILAKTKA